MKTQSLTFTDLSPIINQILKVVWWLIPLALLVLILKSRWAKGYFGELSVRFKFWLRLNKKTYQRIHNVTLPTLDGTTQIDHVLVSPFGIFVIETKNMQGWIFGNELHAQWTQSLYKKSFRFQNPLRQNYRHVKTLEAALHIPAETIHSVVAFVGGSTFKTAMPENVTDGAGLVAYIKSFRETVFSEVQVSELMQIIQADRLAPTFATYRVHVQNLKSRLEPDATRLCPKCGSPLVLRTAKSGANAGQQFWGCSIFPKCRGIQNLS